ncbi:hypothetical protein BELL_0534g00010 [Botrytis elliptica]|uniref:Heterokaryon incompatibility domain-containing protein n=1 Tax=Botrytis elliptica TaxID=278938 RepID=A0A4Z1JR66_9HELO|nr:hypothetical protein EAE99_007845 [Botrytis elliptica]TGO71753.1 hypothetical protein BELL_0534g00010 [Botrytis elliptica]
MENLQYQAIEPPHEIRMVELIPGTASTPIQVRLVHKSLSQMPQCIALSYEWGARTGDSEIICDNATLKVTKNLIKGLKRLRKFQGLAPDHNPDSNRLKITEKTLYWIDAICINQDDLDERSQQVPLMGSIYKNASRVVVWRGEEVARSQEVWDLVAPLGDQVDKFKVNVIEKNKEEYGSTIVCPGLMLKDLSKHPAFVDIMDTFSARTLFIRLWTIQETCLAHGSQVTILQIQENAPLSQEDFFDMLLASTFVHASDERDRVFGVLGLFGEDTRAPFSNLGYRNEPEETFRAATEAIVNTCDKVLEYLTYNYAAVISGDTLLAWGLVFDTVTIAYPKFSSENFEKTLLNIHFTVRADSKAAETNNAEIKLGRLKKDDTLRRDHNDQLTGEGRNIFATSKEYFGIGAYGKNDPGSPLAVQVNDKIVIMHGVKQPLVLYPCGNSEYKFVGPSLIPEVETDE